MKIEFIVLKIPGDEVVASFKVDLHVSNDYPEVKRNSGYKTEVWINDVFQG